MKKFILIFILSNCGLFNEVLGQTIAELEEGATKGNVRYMLSLANCYKSGYDVKQDYEKAFYWYQKAADAGSPSGMAELGFAYHNGRGVEKDLSESMKWYKKSAELGNSWAMLNIGWRYYDGEGVTQNYEEALSWIEKSASLNNAAALRSLGYCYRNGYGTSANWDKAIEYSKKAADLGDKQAMYNYALYLEYCSENGINASVNRSNDKTEADFNNLYDYLMYLGHERELKDKKDIFEYMERAAMAGYKDAFFEIAKYYDGKGPIGMGYNGEKALYWYKRAAYEFYLNAMDRLAEIYLTGKYYNIPKDEHKGKVWQNIAKDFRKKDTNMSRTRKAAVEGDVDAMYFLGVTLFEGTSGRPKKPEEGLIWLRKAAGLNHATANYELGKIYLNGKFVEQNYATAFNYYLAAAKLGDVDAMSYIGRAYIKGKGCEKDFNEAVKWLSMAVEKGEPEAMSSLGMRYVKGEGVEKNMSKAIELFEQGMKRGNRTAASNLTIAQYEEGKTLYKEAGTAMKENKTELAEQLYQRAFTLFKKASENYINNNAKAMNYLAACYMNGRGTKENKELGEYWRKQAALDGDMDAREVLDYQY